jgi:hypothetical protein
VPHRAAVEVLCAVPENRDRCGTDTLVCAWCVAIAVREKSGCRRSRRENRSPRVHPWDSDAYRFASPPWRARESFLSPVKTDSQNRATLKPPARSCNGLNLARSRGFTTERWRPRRLARLRLAAGPTNVSPVAGNETPVQASHSAARTQPRAPTNLKLRPLARSWRLRFLWWLRRRCAPGKSP